MSIRRGRAATYFGYLSLRGDSGRLANVAALLAEASCWLRRRWPAAQKSARLRRICRRPTTDWRPPTAEVRQPPTGDGGQRAATGRGGGMGDQVEISSIHLLV